MTRESLVVDASLVVSVLIESGSAAARIVDRLADSRVHAPNHLWVEVSNVLRRRRNAGQLSAAESRIAFDGLWMLPIESWPLEVLSERVWELGANVTSYDAAYVALAEHIDAPLLTLDVRLSRAAGPKCLFEVFGQ